MKKIIHVVYFLFCAISLTMMSEACATGEQPDTPVTNPPVNEPTASDSVPSRDSINWKLAWSEEFNTPTIASSVWSKIPKGEAAWRKYMSDDDRLFNISDGVLTLKAMCNDVLGGTPYITGGLWTRGLKSFEMGYIEIRAKLHGGKGAWPAIWMLPWDNNITWPLGGEIDIMERLNNDSYIHQTVHTNYTYNLKRTQNPPNTKTVAINPDEYNIYGVKIEKDRLVFYVNNHPSFIYPRITNGALGQYPFIRPYYLIIDMQLGGWAGAINAANLPMTMQIDWIRYYIQN